MQTAKKVLRTIFLVIPFLFAGNVFAAAADDYAPEVTARVARINFLRGEARIRRADSDDWERATLNLPVVEGDEIATDSGARLEIQFSSRSYLRLNENSYLKIVNLKDEGIAVSLPQGSLSLRLLEFDKDRTFFEIDAPKTTVSVQKKGMYRVDAGDERSAEIRVAASDDGEARIYSETSGFTLRSGRSAKIFLEGNYAGEWETADASRFADEFDSWSMQRDATIARLLRQAHYDEYYDRDIYGAEDLSEYGEWIHTRKYGYVWRPFKNSVSQYANWSPYRYGQWRWIEPFGWTWVNDEPWGWATYHHGRWIYDDGTWVWTPYGQYRSSRSWWQPALVILTTISNNVCWYPLPYSYAHYDYNRHYRRNNRRNNTTIINNNTTVIVNNTAAANPPPIVPAEDQPIRGDRRRYLTSAPVETVPLTGVVAISASQFGRDRRGFAVAPVEIARTALIKSPQIIETPPVLPTFRELNGRVSRDIQAAAPPFAATEKPIRTGAIVRQEGNSMDEELRRTRIFGNRPPVEVKPDTSETKPVTERLNERRRTGAVVRQETNNSSSEDNAPETKKPNRSVFTPRDDSQNNSEDQKPRFRDNREIERPRRDKDDEKQSPPAYSPPLEKGERIRPERREQSPPKENTRRREPENQPPPRDEPQREKPKREEPKREEPKRTDPPPSKSEPKEDRKSPRPPLIEGKRDNDGN